MSAGNRAKRWSRQASGKLYIMLGMERGRQDSLLNYGIYGSLISTLHVQDSQMAAH
jgi:hypothetical protein